MFSFFALWCWRNAYFSHWNHGFCQRWFSPFHFFDPLISIFFQGAAAAAAGRGSPPPPGAGVRQTVAIPFQEHGVRGTRWYKARGAGGLGEPQLPAPARPGAAFCGREQQGGLGEPQLPAPAPPGAAFAIPLERNGASGGWGPAVRNGAPVQARAHLLKNHALACTRA